MIDLNDFYNHGFGWVCRHCESEIALVATHGPSRLMCEGEAEGKNPQLSSPALAKWADPERKTLVCPRCGITEIVDVS